MTIYKLQIIESAITLLAFIVLKFSMRYIVKLTISQTHFKKKEEKEILRLINLLLLAVFCVIIVAIWGVRQNQILVFATSLITVLGVAFFAEMSILSNVTACLILFFQHPVKIGDIISITLEGNKIEGELIDITYFFVYIKTSEKGILTIPNALLLKSSFLVRDKSGTA